jgi:hypothetical protein
MKRVIAIAAVAVFASGCSYIGLPGFGGHHDQVRGQQRPPAAMPNSPRRHAPSAAVKPFSASLEYGFEGKSSSEFHTGGFATDVFLAESRDWNDSHDNANRVALRGGYALNSKTEIGASVSYTQANSSGAVTIGNAGPAPAGTTNFPLTAEFGDFEKLGLELDARRYMGQTGGLRSPILRPFVGATLGVSRVTEMDVTLRSAGLPNIAPASTFTNPTTVGFYDESWVPTAGINAGVQVQFNRFAALEFETGLRYDGELEQNDTALRTLTDGVSSAAVLNDTGSRVVLPVTLRGRINF